MTYYALPTVVGDGWGTACPFAFADRVTRARVVPFLSVTGAGEAAKYLDGWLEHFRKEFDAKAAQSEVSPLAKPVSQVELAKAEWKARALREAAFTRRLLEAATDPEGVPMPPTDADDDLGG